MGGGRLPVMKKISLSDETDTVIRIDLEATYHEERPAAPPPGLRVLGARVDLREWNTSRWSPNSARDDADRRTCYIITA